MQSDKSYYMPGLACTHPDAAGLGPEGSRAGAVDEPVRAVQPSPAMKRDRHSRKRALLLLSVPPGLRLPHHRGPAPQGTGSTDTGGAQGGSVSRVGDSGSSLARAGEAWSSR